MHIVVELEPGNLRCSNTHVLQMWAARKLEMLWLVPVNNENSWISFYNQRECMTCLWRVCDFNKLQPPYNTTERKNF
jgi:hypothetical protein